MSEWRGEFERSLERFAEVLVAFLPHEGLVVPDSVRPTEGVAQVMSYGLDMPVPIPDLLVDDRGISATLLFSGEFVKTFLPWGSVIGVKGLYERVVKRQRPKLSLVP